MQRNSEWMRFNGCAERKWKLRIFIMRIISWNNNNQDFYDNSKINKKKNIRMHVFGCEWEKINLYIFFCC